MEDQKKITDAVSAKQGSLENAQCMKKISLPNGCNVTMLFSENDNPRIRYDVAQMQLNVFLQKMRCMK